MEAGDLALNFKVAPASISSSEDRGQKFAKAVDSLIATPLPEDIVAVTEMSSNDDNQNNEKNKDFLEKNFPPISKDEL